MLKGLLNISRHTVNLIWVCVNLFFLTGLVAASYMGYIPPSRFPMAQLINMSFPFWAVASFLLLIANLFFSRRLALLWAFGMVACGGQLLSFCPLNFGKPSIQPSDSTRMFKVMTYNVKSLDDQQAMEPDWGSRSLAYIISMNPDIVCVQEPSYFMEGHRPRFSAQSDSLGELYHYYTPFDRFDYDQNLMILSKYPLRDVTPEQPAWSTGSYLAYDIDVEGRQLTVINVHLQSIGLTPDDKALYRDLTDHELTKPTRQEISQVKNNIVTKLNETFRIHEEQARHIARFINEKGAKNVVLAGDFNDVPGSYVYRYICRECGLMDVYAECGLGPIITYNDNRFYFHIDQILYRGDMTAVGIVRGNIKSSDHYPLTATFVWNE